MQLKRAFEKSLDLIGEPSKKSLLLYLEREHNITFAESNSPKLEEIEYALRSVLGQGATIMTNELRKNLGQPERGPGRKPIGTRQGKSLA